MLMAPLLRHRLRGEVLGRDAIGDLQAAWEDLCGRSAEDNVYYSPRYATALLDSVEARRDVRFAVVWEGSTLVALLPFTRSRLALPLLLPAGKAWQSKFTYSCTPLLDSRRRTEAASALLDVLAESGSEWVLPCLNVAGPACQAMIAALDRRGMPHALTSGFQRAALDAGTTFEEHMRRHVRPKRRNELARAKRRLEERGRVAHACYRSGASLDQAVDAFLEIEARGWKGRRGTALASDERTLDFAKRAFTDTAGPSICRADVLALDDKPIAVGLTVFAGATGFTVKGAYDENYRSYGAGLLLEIEVIRSFLEDGWASRLDAGTDGTHVIDDLWPLRLEVANLMFSLAPGRPDLRLALRQRSERAESLVRSRLKAEIARFQHYAGRQS